MRSSGRWEMIGGREKNLWKVGWEEIEEARAHLCLHPRKLLHPGKNRGRGWGSDVKGHELTTKATVR